MASKILSYQIIRRFSSARQAGHAEPIVIRGIEYPRDSFTNVTPKILSFIGKNKHNQEKHPLCLLKKRITNYFYTRFAGRTGNPIFSMYDSIHPVVTVHENFDSLLIPKDHVSRSKSDCYYINEKYLLRAHTTAHQSELISMGLDNFVVFGDTYRRDEIDSSHYPVFHQADSVRLCNQNQLCMRIQNEIEVFEKKPTEEFSYKQPEHTLDASKVVEQELKAFLIGLTEHLFGKVGAGDRIGWAFGLGLERLAMALYSIPDIRLFWSEDPGFLCQFDVEDVNKNVTYKPVSEYPPCINDISFWLPETQEYSSNDFYDLVRSVGGDLIEQIRLIDSFTHPKKGTTSHCYRIVYRHLEKTLTQEEVNQLHKAIELAAAENLQVKIR
ncbi:probable phenylalanine--tRNA ligase, mitochondrial isoform X2 [Bemisia tabaci]|uniref:probable phenylalanine--tRNA ligase, mitochondrial isoform X2 n=1 Tax=Bemisia tabaci TaxID=7038 RepID=UPI003B2882B3